MLGLWSGHAAQVQIAKIWKVRWNQMPWEPFGRIVTRWQGTPITKICWSMCSTTVWPGQQLNGTWNWGRMKFVHGETLSEHLWVDTNKCRRQPRIAWPFKAWRKDQRKITESMLSDEKMWHQRSDHPSLVEKKIPCSWTLYPLHTMTCWSSILLWSLET